MWLDYLTDWLSLSLRFLHIIAGIAWIGASFYFNWLENNLHRHNQRKGIAGNLWAVHGGGYYYLEKYQIYPDKQPEVLHWFKWEAYITWLSGFALFVFLYYFNAQSYLLTTSSAITISPHYAVLLSALGLPFAWFIYDVMCRANLARYPRFFSVILCLLVLIFAYLYGLIFAAKTVFIQLGAMMGTIMAANVFFVIIPVQRTLVNACENQTEVEAKLGLSAYHRSRHNNYITLPVILMMISGHAPHLYSGEYFYWVLFMVVVISALIRHIFNLRGEGKPFVKELVWGVILLSALIVLMRFHSISQIKQVHSVHATEVSLDQVRIVVNKHCVSCHQSQPTQQGFSQPPLGFMLHTDALIQQGALKIYQNAVLNPVMPPGNLTHMSDEERHLLRIWYDNIQKKGEK